MSELNLDNINFLNEGLFKATEEGKFDCKRMVKNTIGYLNSIANEILQMINLYSPILNDIINSDINNSSSIKKIESNYKKSYNTASELYDEINNEYKAIFTDKFALIKILSKNKLKFRAELKDSSVKERYNELIKSCSSGGEIYNTYNDLSNKYKEFIKLWDNNQSKFFEVQDKFTEYDSDDSMRINIKFLKDINKDIINLPNKIISIIK